MARQNQLRARRHAATQGLPNPLEAARRHLLKLLSLAHRTQSLFQSLQSRNIRDAPDYDTSGAQRDDAIYGPEMVIVRDLGTGPITCSWL